LIFFRISASLLNSSFISCIIFLICLAIYLSSLGIHSDVYLYSLNSFWCLYMFYLISLTTHIILLSSGCLVFSYFLCFCFEICASEAKSLVGSFSHL
jgi:hypothetical protein